MNRKDNLHEEMEIQRNGSETTLTVKLGTILSVMVTLLAIAVSVGFAYMTSLSTKQQTLAEEQAKQGVWITTMCSGISKIEGTVDKIQASVDTIAGAQKRHYEISEDNNYRIRTGVPGGPKK